MTKKPSDKKPWLRSLFSQFNKQKNPGVRWRDRIAAALHPDSLEVVVNLDPSFNLQSSYQDFDEIQDFELPVNKIPSDSLQDFGFPLEISRLCMQLQKIESDIVNTEVDLQEAYSDLESLKSSTKNRTDTCIGLKNEIHNLNEELKCLNFKKQILSSRYEYLINVLKVASF